MMRAQDLDAKTTDWAHEVLDRQLAYRPDGDDFWTSRASAMADSVHASESSSASW